MWFEPLFCPECGEQARGTLETAAGVAEFEVTAGGSIEYTGETDVWWDEQRTVADAGGYVRLVCRNGHDWSARGEGLHLPRETGAEVQRHAGETRACEYESCQVRGRIGEMAQFAGGEWYCPRHGLLLVARDLIALDQGDSEADLKAICEIIGTTLPDLVAKAEAREARKRA